MLRHGFGRGTAIELERAHAAFVVNICAFLSVAEAVGLSLANSHLAVISLDRLCDDIRVLLDRATGEVSVAMKTAPQVPDDIEIPQSASFEYVYQGPLSMRIARAACSAVVDLAIALDVLAKLIDFVNGAMDMGDRPSAKGKLHASDVAKMKANHIASPTLEKIKALFLTPSLGPMTQLRHDLVHNTTGLDIERSVYWGRATPAVANASIGYVYVPWRDTQPNGQPIRALGRSFFVEQERNLLTTLVGWLFDVGAVVDGTVRLLIEASESGQSKP